MKITVRQKLLLFLLLILTGIGAMGYADYLSHQKLLASARWVEHTQQVIGESDNLLLLEKEVEIASQGFVITGDSAFLKPLYTAERHTTEYIARLRKLTRDNPPQQQRIDSLNFYIEKHLDYSFQTADLRSKQGLTAAIAITFSKQGRKYSTDISRITNDILQEENRLLKQRTQTNDSSVAAFDLFSLAIFILMAVFTILLSIVTIRYLFQNQEKEKREAELTNANTELVFQNEEKQKRSAELIGAYKELAFQNEEKEKRSGELIIANEELVFQSEEKEKRSGELIIANEELVFQNEEKEKRSAELIGAYRELAFQNEEKEKRAAELTIAYEELVFQNSEREKRAAELIVANKELVFQNEEKEKTGQERIQSERRLARAQQIAHMGSWELDFATNDFLWSEEACRIYGVPPGLNRQSFKSWLSYIHPEDLDFVLKKVKESRVSPGNFFFHHRIVLADGAIRHIYSESKLDFDSSGKSTGMHGITYDETERKIAEQKLAQQNTELVKTNFEMDRFVYSVSHDLRSPLTSVLGLVSFIEEESKEADTIKHAGMIRNRIKRLDGFIKNILDYARNNRTGLQVEKIPMQKTADEIVDSLRSMKDAQGINFEVNINEQQPFYSDLPRFSSILENLIANAIKYHKKKEPGRYIKVMGKSDKDNLHLRIEDNGIGIAPEYHAKIFEMFFRLSGKKTGSGIGLYIVKEIIEKLQGTIEIHSEEGKGTSFIIEIKNLIP